MRHRHGYIIFKRNSEEVELIKAHGKTLVDHEWFYTLDLYSENEEDVPLIKILSELGELPGIVEEYTQEEMDSAPFLQVQPIWSDYYPEPQDSNYGYGVTHRKIGECSCNANLEQVKDFSIMPLIKKMEKPFLELNWVYDEIFVSASVKELLQASELKGFGFRNLWYKRKNRPQPDTFQIDITRISPPVMDMSRMKIQWDNSCPLCGAKRVFLEQGSPLAVTEEMMSQTDVDIFKAPEYFGQGANWSRKIFISHRFYTFLKEHLLDSDLRYQIPVIGGD